MNSKTGKIEKIVVGNIETNCWLYAPEIDYSGKGKPCFVIDPGDDGDLILGRLKELDLTPLGIFFTHGHFDHLAALPELLAAFEKGSSGGSPFPQTGIHRLDAHFLGKDALSFHRTCFAAAGGNPAYLDAVLKPLPEADLLFEEGDKAGPFTVLHLPGHSAGSVAFFDEKAGVLFSGDTLFRGSWGRTDLPGGSENDLSLSLKRLFSMNGEIVVCPGHGPATTIGEEKGLVRQLGLIAGL